MTSATTAHPPAPDPARNEGVLRTLKVALLGNPNTGKTTIFNALSGLRARTANFPGITAEARVGAAKLATDTTGEVIDLPGVYSMQLDLTESKIVSDVLDGKLAVSGMEQTPPQALVVVLDAANMARNLLLVGEALQRGLPTVVAVNKIDVARRKGLEIDADRLQQELGCPVVKMCARRGEGVAELRRAVLQAHAPTTVPPSDLNELHHWADEVYGKVGAVPASDVGDGFTDRLDQAFTHPIVGLGVFGLIMGALFYTIFYFAQWPMEIVDSTMMAIAAFVQNVLPAGILSELLVDGVIAGIAGVVIFLPQIVLLFFLLTLLEDTGYLARAAFVMDRIFRRFGLPGQAFVPFLSCHACAIPGIMAARLIPDKRDRLATILVAPFMTCSARLPVYVLCVALLFGERPALAALAFFGAYILGGFAALFSAVFLRATILKGKSRPMALELPAYNWPSLKNAALASLDRATVFLKQAGTVILAISIIMWGLSRYPGSPPTAEAEQMREQAAQVETAQPDLAEELRDRADKTDTQNQLANSFAGKLGQGLEPIFAPLGYDWRVTIGVVSSFAAREVFVSTMAILMGTGEEADVDDDLLDRMKSSQRADGTPLFTMATSASLLVFYVLAMQCLPTLAVTRRESGSWKWPLLQLGWMTAVAYVFALITYQGLLLLGVS